MKPRFGQQTVQSGQQADRNLRAPDSRLQSRRTARGRIGQLTALLCLLFFASCGVTERISTEREVNVEMRPVSVPVPGHVRTVPLSASDLPQTAADTLTIQDDRVRITVRKSAEVESPLEGSTAEAGRGVDSELINDPFLLNYLLDIEVFPDTVYTTIPQTTITERTETTRYQTKTGRFAWMVIGGLIAVVIVLLVAFRIRR